MEWNASNASTHNNHHNMIINKFQKVRFAGADNESNVAADDATDDGDDVNVKRITLIMMTRRTM